jgi:hypothetical protein
MPDMTDLQPNVILHGEQLFGAGIDLIIHRAQREILIFDRDLSSGGYTTPARADAIQSVLAKDRHNKLVILLHDTGFVTQRCPRLMRLLQLFGHAMTIHKTGEGAHSAQDSIILADGLHYLHRFHGDHARFRYGFDDAAAVQPLKERFDQILETSTHAISATTLGL